MINDINNPLASVFPATLALDANGVPTIANVPPLTTIPANEPVVGDTQGFFAGRVYAPSGIESDESDLTVLFAGYHTHKPKNGLGDYRTIGRVSLHSSEDISSVGANGELEHHHGR